MTDFLHYYSIYKNHLDVNSNVLDKIFSRKYNDFL